MEQERRSERRKVINGLKNGSLSVLVDGRELPVRAVVDVSPTGVGLLVGEEVRVDAPVEVSFRCAQIEIDMVGTTVWASRREPEKGGDAQGAFVIGVSLVSPTLLHNFL